MKDIIVLEVNHKKNNLGVFEIDTPSEFLLVNNTEPIINNQFFDEFLDYLFELVTEELVNEFDKKITNIYATFIDDNDHFVCSVVLDKFKPKRGLFRFKIIDWKSSGYTFKYDDEGENQ